MRRLVQYLSYSKELLVNSDDEMLRKLAKYPFWFMQDGAPAHRSMKVIRFLQRKYGARLLAKVPSALIREDDTPWSPYSPDENPSDFFLWGKYKASIRAKAPKDETELRNATQEFFDNEYSHDEMIKVVESLPSRWRATYYLNGDHVEKMSSKDRHELGPVPEELRVSQPNSDTSDEDLNDDGDYQSRLANQGEDITFADIEGISQEISQVSVQNRDVIPDPAQGHERTETAGTVTNHIDEDHHDQNEPSHSQSLFAPPNESPENSQIYWNIFRNPWVENRSASGPRIQNRSNSRSRSNSGSRSNSRSRSNSGSNMQSNHRSNLVSNSMSNVNSNEIESTHETFQITESQRLRNLAAVTPPRPITYHSLNPSHPSYAIRPSFLDYQRINLTETTSLLAQRNSMQWHMSSSQNTPSNGKNSTPRGGSSGDRLLGLVSPENSPIIPRKKRIILAPDSPIPTQIISDSD